MSKYKRRRDIVVCDSQSSDECLSSCNEDEEEEYDFFNGHDDSDQFSSLSSPEQDNNNHHEDLISTKTPKNEKGSMEKGVKIKTITSVDPGPRNMTVFKYSLEDDESEAMAWIDLQGKNMSKLTSKQLRERLIQVFEEMSWLFDSDVILVEKQNKMSKACHKIQKTYKKYFKGKCKIVCPKKTKAGVLEKMDKVPEYYTCERTKKRKRYMWASTTTTTLGNNNNRPYKKVMKYGEKKRASVALGNMLMRGDERSMFSSLKSQRSQLAMQVKQHDEAYIGRKSCNRKRPRRIKTRPDDVFDSMLIALEYASEHTGINYFEKRLTYSPYSSSTLSKIDLVNPIEATTTTTTTIIPSMFVRNRNGNGVFSSSSPSSSMATAAPIEKRYLPKRTLIDLVQ